ncbi:MAG: RadC family protein [Alphaproteobacteria bacterium]|nr:RadC family protein [Alphaproteobacteria bacterium]
MTTHTETTVEIPDYIGHRKRLRERFLKDNGASMPDYEILELMLTMVIPRKDVKPLAKKLLHRYKSLLKVLHASHLELKEDFKLSDNVIALFEVVNACNLRLSAQFLYDPDCDAVTNRIQFEEMLKEKIGFKPVEELWIFYFDAKMRYLGEKQISSGTIDSTAIYPRELFVGAYQYRAKIVYLAHNHPSGIARPSDADIAVTNFIIEACSLFNVDFGDHIIVTADDTYSMLDHGVFKLPKKKKLQLTEDEF